MRFEKLQCDGCKKEYFLGTTELTIRIVNKVVAEKRAANSLTLVADSVQASIPLNNSLDFCNATCFQTYLNVLKTPPEEPKEV